MTQPVPPQLLLAAGCLMLRRSGGQMKQAQLRAAGAPRPAVCHYSVRVGVARRPEGSPMAASTARSFSAVLGPPWAATPAARKA
jgi:hypothetical protein